MSISNLGIYLSLNLGIALHLNLTLNPNLNPFLNFSPGLKFSLNLKSGFSVAISVVNPTLVPPLRARLRFLFPPVWTFFLSMNITNYILSFFLPLAFSTFHLSNQHT